MTPEMIEIHRLIAALTSSIRALREVLVAEVAAGNPETRARVERHLLAAYDRQLQYYLEQIENLDPALAAKLDYRDYPPMV